MPWRKYNGNQKLNKKVDHGKARASSKAKGACVEVKGGTTNDCVNDTVAIEALRTGAVAKIPVVLAELTIQINVDAFIKLPEPAWEIKDIKKRVKVTQCLLLQDTNMLFIKGFVRKNIDYSTRTCSNREGFCGDIKHCTIDVPFSCTTPVDFNGIAPLPPKTNCSKEFEYLKTEEISQFGFAEKDKLMSGDLREFNQISKEFFNELPFCELIKARIVEFDEQINPVHPDKCDVPFEEKKFTKIEEKMVIYLTLKLLQKRQVAIGAIDGVGGTGDCDIDC